MYALYYICRFQRCPEKKRKFSWAEYCLIWMDEHEELIELRLSAHAYLLTIRCYRRFVDFLQDSDKEYKVNIVTTTEII